MLHTAASTDYGERAVQSYTGHYTVLNKTETHTHSVEGPQDQLQ